MALTRKQKNVLDFISTYISKNKVSPTHFEIKEHFKFKSLGSVQDYIRYLSELGFLEKTKGTVRGLKLSGGCPMCGGKA